jgi:putative PIN family toxin of toxin-antitoxin system
MIGVVLDTNVYVSALLFGGNPRAVVELAEDGLIELWISDSIKGEVERILAKKFSWPQPRVRDAASYLWSLTQPVAPRQTVTDCTDPDDNRILECALAAHAEIIVTGDGHLLKLHPYKRILVLTPRQFLESKPWERSNSGADKRT